MNKSFTKNLFSLALMLLFCGTMQTQAQESKNDSAWSANPNLVKMNVAALVTKSFSFQYERAVSKRISVALGYRFMPQSGVPLKSSFLDLVDDQQTKTTIDNFKTSNFAITPEVRFYVGKGVFRGFYLAPYARYAKYKAEGPFEFEITQLNTTETMYFKGDVNTFTGGLMLGAQWKLSKLVYLDWWIVGASYGHSKGNLVGKRTLNAFEQEELRNQLNDFTDDLPILKATSTVDGNGATIDFKGPWAGLRAGLNVGFRF